jgi:hypothetical protein
MEVTPAILRGLTLSRTSRHWYANPHPTPRIFCDTLYLRVKILYVSQYFPPEMGAPAARAAELAHHWSHAGHDISVLTGVPNHPSASFLRNGAPVSAASRIKKESVA